MLVSGGQILAIDKVNTGNTILGDGVQKPLNVNTDLIATTSSVSSVSSTLEQQINSIKTNQTIVSAGSPNVTVDTFTSGDNTVIYAVNVQEGAVNIAGASGVSTKYDNGTWTIGLSADYVSSSDFNQFKTDVNTALEQKQDVSAMTAYAQSAWVDEHYQKKGEYVTSADTILAGKQLVLKDNEWQELTETDWTDKISAASAVAVTSAKNYTDTKLEDYYKKNETSSKDELEEEFAKYQLKGNYLSANALDDLSGKWESVYNTTVTASGNWNEASAFAANSAKFVTSADVEFDPALAYFLKKRENESVAWSGVDLSDLGKMYQLSSLTPDLISAGISADGQNNPFYVISAAEQDKVPEISGYGISAWKDAENNEYKVSAHIIGNHGVSAEYDADNNTWNIGISANDYSFLFGHYTNNAVLTDGTVLKLDSNNYHGIAIDDDGYITLPETVNKFTFCVNEYIDDNTTQEHNYLLNKLVLSAKGNDQIVASQNYYPSEVGASNVTLALTIDATTAPNREYCIVYKGSDVATNKLHVEASILEEVTSLDSTGGAAQDYTGQNPIRVVDNSKIIQLLYDSNVFSLKHDEVLQADILTIEGSGGEVVNKETFDKLLNSVNGRIVETMPIGTVNQKSTLEADHRWAYVFRPMIQFDMNPTTTARIITSNASANTSTVIVAVYELDEANNEILLQWWSAPTVLSKAKGEHILFANDSCTETKTIYPDRLYYVTVLCYAQQIEIIGETNSITSDVGDWDIAYVAANINTTQRRDPTTYDGSDMSTSPLGDTAGSTLKPYVGFKNVINE